MWAVIVWAAVWAVTLMLTTVMAVKLRAVNVFFLPFQSMEAVPRHRASDVSRGRPPPYDSSDDKSAVSVIAVTVTPLFFYEESPHMPVSASAVSMITPTVRA